MAEKRNSFAMVPDWLLYSPDVNPTAIKLWCVLHRFANKRDQAWPSRAKLAERMTCSIRTVDSALKTLRMAGALLVEPRISSSGDHSSNLYTLVWTPETLSKGDEESEPTHANNTTTPPVIEDSLATPSEEFLGAGDVRNCRQNESDSMNNTQYEREPVASNGTPAVQQPSISPPVREKAKIEMPATGNPKLERFWYSVRQEFEMLRSVRPVELEGGILAITGPTDQLHMARKHEKQIIELMSCGVTQLDYVRLDGCHLEERV